MDYSHVLLPERGPVQPVGPVTCSASAVPILIRCEHLAQSLGIARAGKAVLGTKMEETSRTEAKGELCGLVNRWAALAEVSAQSTTKSNFILVQILK